MNHWTLFYTMYDEHGRVVDGGIWGRYSDLDDVTAQVDEHASASLRFSLV